MSRTRPGTSRCALPFLLLGVLLVSGRCTRPAPTDPLDSKSELVILTRNSATTYFEDRDGRWVGPELELASAFARFLNLKARFEVEDSIDGILAAVALGRVDLAAAGLTRTESRARQFSVGPVYQTIEERVVCHPQVSVRQAEDLVLVRLRVASGSSHQESLLQLKTGLPKLRWTTSSEDSPEQLLQQVADGLIDCTIADSNILAVERRSLPELKNSFGLGGEQSLVWLLARDSAYLEPRLQEWFDGFEKSGRLRALLDRYYGHVEGAGYHDTAVFLQRVEERLPDYRALFLEASATSGLPWTLLAALAYQESHWDPVARSRTGVRGMMMLTRHTAESLGVTDRLDPRQSVPAGARYLAKLADRVPPFIPDPDRLWMALAAYNVGLAHVQDARLLAVELNRNPNSWLGVKSCLPLLSQKRYYLRLPHGYARGHEPVAFVERVRNYRDLLQQTARAPAGPANRGASGTTSRPGDAALRAGR